MMSLSKEQVAFIREDIRKRGIKDEDLLNELTDHICSMIEERGFDDGSFPEIHRVVMNEFGDLPLLQTVIDGISKNKKNTEMKTIKTSAIFLVAFASFLLFVSWLMENTGHPAVAALRTAALTLYATTGILVAVSIIRQRIKLLQLKIAVGLTAYLYALILLFLGIRQVNVEAGNNLINSLPYVFASAFVAAGILFVAIRKKLLLQ
jgi:hypothetical protein